MQMKNWIEVYWSRYLKNERFDTWAKGRNYSYDWWGRTLIKLDVEHFKNKVDICGVVTGEFYY